MKRGANHVDKHGKIFIDSVRRGKSYPNKEGLIVLPVWSRGAKPWCELSPFVLGPVVLDDCKQVALRFENFWQAQKVYKEIPAQKGAWNRPIEKHLNDDGEPNESWYKWNEDLCQYNVPIRRPAGRVIPEYAWWNGEKLGIVEARKQIYIPHLQKLYRAHKTYHRILALVAGGQDVCLVEPDGTPDFFELSHELCIQLQNVTRICDIPGGNYKQDKYMPYGHGFVIALTLFEDLAASTE